jgi:hypothetical protein
MAVGVRHGETAARLASMEPQCLAKRHVVGLRLLLPQARPEAHSVDAPSQSWTISPIRRANASVIRALIHPIASANRATGLCRPIRLSAIARTGSAISAFRASLAAYDDATRLLSSPLLQPKVVALLCTTLERAPSGLPEAQCKVVSGDSRHLSSAKTAESQHLDSADGEATLECNRPDRPIASSAWAYVRPINFHNGKLTMIATIVQAA